VGILTLTPNILDYDFYGQVALVALDIPLCVVADTLSLPYDAYQSQQ
jgi:uncharacterized protein YceK